MMIHTWGKTRENNCLCAQAAMVTSTEEPGSLSVSVTLESAFDEGAKPSFFFLTKLLPFLSRCC